MARPPNRYAPRSASDVIDLVRRHPLAWIVTAGESFGASPVPVLPEIDDSGALVGLKGHFGRGNPLVVALKSYPRCLILFLGNNSYISPSWMDDRTQAPSWNYESVTFECELRFLDEPGEPLAHLGELTGVHEAGRPDAWSVSEMGARYDLLSRGVAAFHAEIRETRPVFKLGQDERPDVFANIMTGLVRTGQTTLAERMTAQSRSDRP